MRNWLNKFLIPHENNDYKPHALQRAALVGMALMVMISFAFANLQSILWISSEWLVSTILPAVVTDATNAARAGEGKAALVRNSTLDEAARLKAEDMAAKEYFAHWSPDGVSPWYWFSEAGYSYKHAGENLAVHFTDSDEVVEAWLDSPTHRENIMDARFTEIGIGTAKGRYQDYDTVFVVQMFGTPATATAVEPAVVEPEIIDDVPTEVEIDAPVEVAGVAETEGSEDVEVTEAGTVVYESFAVTTDPEAVLSQSSVEPSASWWGKLATSPRLVLQIIYSIIGVLVFLALLLSIVIEWRRQHPVQLAYGMAMLAFMAILFQLHNLVAANTLIG